MVWVWAGQPEASTRFIGVPIFERAKERDVEENECKGIPDIGGE